MSDRFLCICLLVYCIIGCSTDTSDDASIFPVPPIISENQKETTTPEIQIDVVNPLVPELIDEPVVAAELMDNIAQTSLRTNHQ